MLATIPTDMIETGRRLREISEAHVASLINSIGDVGLLNPITVYKRRIIRDNVQVDGFGLVAGAHRLEACKRLGLVDIDAQVVSLGELERQIAECDENLCGASLTASERAMFTARRKDAYEALHPETRHGGNLEGAGVANIATPEIQRFTADTATKTGRSERAVQLDAERGARVCPQALHLVRNSHLDTGSYIDKLKPLDPQAQIAKIRADLKAGKPPKAPRIADQPESDEAAIERQVAGLMSAWNKAAPEARREFMARVDRPVMDRRFA